MYPTLEIDTEGELDRLKVVQVQNKKQNPLQTGVLSSVQ